MARNRPQVGSRDYCQTCGEVIVLAQRSDFYRVVYWQHKDTEKRECANGKDRAVSRTYCGEHMNTAWTTDICLRPIKDQVRMMCGIHAAHARRAEERDRKYHEKWELNDYISTELQKMGLRFKEEFGLTVKAEYDFHNHTYTGRIVVDPVELMAFLNDIAGNPPDEEEEDDDDVEWEATGN